MRLCQWVMVSAWHNKLGLRAGITCQDVDILFPYRLWTLIDNDGWRQFRTPPEHISRGRRRGWNDDVLHVVQFCAWWCTKLQTNTSSPSFSMDKNPCLHSYLQHTVPLAARRKKTSHQNLRLKKKALTLIYDALKSYFVTSCFQRSTLSSMSHNRLPGFNCGAWKDIRFCHLEAKGIIG